MYAAKLLSGPPYYPIGSLDELLIPIGPLFPLQYSFLAWQKPIRGLQRSFVQHGIFFACSQSSIKVCTRLFRSNIGKCYTVVLKQSPIIIISRIYFHLSRCNWKMATAIAHQRNILEIQKPVEVPSQTQHYSFVSKTLNSIL